MFVIRLIRLAIILITQFDDDEMLLQVGVVLGVYRLTQLELVARAVAGKRVHPVIGCLFKFLGAPSVLHQYAVVKRVYVGDVDVKRDRAELDLLGCPLREYHDEVFKFAVPRSVTTLGSATIDLARKLRHEVAAVQ